MKPTRGVNVNDRSPATGRRRTAPMMRLALRPASYTPAARCRLVQRRWLSKEDPDSYYGPGGLSARQIFEKVNESRAKEAAAARIRVARQKKQQTPPPTRLSEQDLANASSKELRQMLVARSVDVSDCFERADLVARARAHLC